MGSMIYMSSGCDLPPLGCLVRGLYIYTYYPVHGGLSQSIIASPSKIEKLEPWKNMENKGIIFNVLVI